MPSTIASMIATGSSLRGLSEVTTHLVGETGDDLPHLRALAGVAVAAGAEHHEHSGVGRDQLAGRGEEVLEAVGRVGVVDDHAEGLAGVDRLEAPGDGRDRGQPGGDVARSPRRARPRASPPPDALATLKRPGDGQVERRSPPPPRGASGGRARGPRRRRASSRPCGSSPRRASSRPRGSSMSTTARSVKSAVKSRALAAK